MDKNKILNDYISWIKNNTFIKELDKGNIFSISTPFLDRHNDCINIYVKKLDNDSYILTDDSYTITDLKMSGFELSSNKRNEIFNTIINGLGVKCSDENELFIETDEKHIGEKKHYLIQAIIQVNEIYNLSQENVKSFFKEDLEIFFRESNIINNKDLKITGQSGVNQNIDFAIPPINNKKEKLIKVINSTRKDTVMLALFGLSDIEKAGRDCELYIIYDDSEKEISPELNTALTKYKIGALAGSQKESIKEKLYTEIFK